MVCFRHIIINSLHKGDNKNDDDDDNNNNNNNKSYHLRVTGFDYSQSSSA